MNMNYHLTRLLVVLLCIVVSESAPQSAIVTELPGFDGTFPSKHYSGYVTIDEKLGKNFFYYFVESERNPAEDPVVLWMNGGPGCSAFDGFIYEHGPFSFEAAKTAGELPKLHLNPYSWSKVSSIIYLDAPSGTGFSYTKDTTEYVTDDVITASDNYAFLLKWFEIYQEYQSNPFYISAESFAAVYVATLASEVVKGLDAGVKPVINFKGYTIGNGVTDDEFDGNALVPFAHGMGLISEDLYLRLTSKCLGNFYNSTDKGCKVLLAKVDQAISGLNQFNILEPCHHGSASNTGNSNPGYLRLPSSLGKSGETDRPLSVRRRMLGGEGIVSTWPHLAKREKVACLDVEVATLWMNDKAVRKAIHVDEENVSGPWEMCTDRITYDHNTGSMIKYHKNLTSHGDYRVLIYSGDHDMSVPYIGSEAWTRSLGYKIVDEWRSWKCNGQVAGYIQGYDNNLTFLTIKGAGHTVPQYKPQESLCFYSRWLDGKPI